MKTLFAYGTLMFPEVQQALTGKTFDMESAVLHKYIRKFKPSSRPFRGIAIVPDQKGIVKGKLLHNIDQQSLKILDFYEAYKGHEYDRKRVTIITKNKEQKLFAYIASKELQTKLQEEWDEQYFKNSIPYHIRHQIKYVLKKYKELN